MSDPIQKLSEDIRVKMYRVIILSQYIGSQFNVTLISLRFLVYRDTIQENLFSKTVFCQDVQTMSHKK